MLESAAGKQNRQVGVVVRIGVAHIAAEQYHRAVQQSLFAIGFAGEVLDESMQ